MQGLHDFRCSNINIQLGLICNSAYQKINFLICQPKHMLWLLKRTVSMRRFFWEPICQNRCVRKYLQFYAKNFHLSKPMNTDYSMLAIRVILCFFAVCCFFWSHFFLKVLSGILYMIIIKECQDFQTFWIHGCQTRQFVRLILDPNCLQRLSTDHTYIRQKVNETADLRQVKYSFSRTGVKTWFQCNKLMFWHRAGMSPVGGVISILFNTYTQIRISAHNYIMLGVHIFSLI